ncbi:MAG TPA: glycosyltransferase [Acidimicrobiales bacterium]|nr:glycosyltransferase [Acidimicrobiales bacterium]
MGYVLKVYPRFSETFILNEILAHEAAGLDLEIFSLRAPADGRFHEALAEVRAPVTYLRHHGRRAAELWDQLGAAAGELPGVADHLDELLAADVDDGAQALELAVLVRRRGIRHLHAHFASVATTVARLASSLTGVPFSFTAHAKDIFHHDVDPAELRRNLQAASAAVTVSDFNLAHLRRAHGSATARTARVYNGLDLERFAYSDPRHRPPVIVGVGRLVEKKGFATLVDACALLAGRGRDFRCTIVGDGPERQALAQRIEHRGVAHLVELAGGRPQGEVRRLVGGSAVLAAPCVVGSDGNRDGLPTVVLEAMALGTPCVATPVTGMPEAVEDGVTGVLVGEGDAEALAEALDRLLVDPGLRSRLAAPARARVEERFEVHRQAARLRAHLGLLPDRSTALEAV